MIPGAARGLFSVKKRKEKKKKLFLGGFSELFFFHLEVQSADALLDNATLDVILALSVYSLLA